MLPFVEVGDAAGMGVTGCAGWVVVGVACVVEEFDAPAHEASKQSIMSILPARLI